MQAFALSGTNGADEKPGDPCASHGLVVGRVERTPCKMLLTVVIKAQS